MRRATPPSWLTSLLELVVPERCRVCGTHLSAREPTAICADCLSRVDYLGAAVCRRCGKVARSAMAGGSLCGECLATPPPWDQAVSVVRYGPVVQQLLHRLKYRADTSVLPALRTIVRPFVESRTVAYSHVLPVPLHSGRLRRRGMNQAVYIARLLFPEQPRLIRTNLLRRNRSTLPQTGLDGAARRGNLRGAFQLAGLGMVQGASVCIVDDVFTTGTTVAECCRVVREAGAAEIKVITLARVVKGG